MYNTSLIIMFFAWNFPVPHFLILQRKIKWYETGINEDSVLYP